MTSSLVHRKRLMAKGKSSASSATRKKHAKKAAKHATTGSGDEEPEQQQQQSGTKGGQTKLQRGQKKVKKDRFAPKVKQYIPPPPPPKGAPDPLDLYVPGGAAAVEADLVVVLKRFMKKDESTLEKGIEGLQEYTNAVVTSERELPEDEQWRWQVRKDELVKIAPVWVSTLLPATAAVGHYSADIDAGAPLWQTGDTREQAHPAARRPASLSPRLSFKFGNDERDARGTPRTVMGRADRLHRRMGMYNFRHRQASQGNSLEILAEHRRQRRLRS